MAVRVVRVSIMAGVLVVAAACGGGPGPGATGPAATGPAAPTGAVACTGSGGSQVAIADNTFNPASATVAVGGSVTWTNADPGTHTVTFNEGPDCGRLAQNASVSRTFTDAGTFTYRCTIHGSMRGSVVVQ